MLTRTQDLIWPNCIGGFSLTEITERVAEGVEQDQIARMCSLILHYILPLDTSMGTNDMLKVQVYITVEHVTLTGAG